MADIDPEDPCPWQCDSQAGAGVELRSPVAALEHAGGAGGIHEQRGRDLEWLAVRLCPMAPFCSAVNQSPTKHSVADDAVVQERMGAEEDIPCLSRPGTAPECQR